MYRWIIFLHVIGAFGFILAHGATSSIMFRLGYEKDRARVSVLLELARSKWVAGVGWGSSLLFLITGIALGFMGGWWRSGWIWSSLAILIVLTIVMGYYGRGFFDPLISALGLAPYEGQEPGKPDHEVGDDEFEALLQAGRPWVLTISGLLGWAAVLWLMMFKPF